MVRRRLEPSERHQAARQHSTSLPRILDSCDATP
jgi:hypothetical protein